jgi:5-methyltetrahydropteroyltriglutamate--homocysteine methyltransferase
VLTCDERVRRRAREAATIGEEGREKGREVLRADDAVCRHALDPVEERSWVELFELVEIRALEPHPKAIFEPSGANGREVARLRTENKDVFHGRRGISVTCVLLARTDVVGSLLRPPELIEAQERHSRGEIDEDGLTRAEDAAVDGAIALQEEAGLEVVTDGEMRRLSFQSQMTAAVEGFGDWDLDAFLWGEWHSEELGDLVVERPPIAVTGKLRRKRFLSAEEFTYARARTDRVLKVTLPSPSLFANFWEPERSTAAYARPEDFLADVAGILREEVDELVRLGATYIQLDAPHYPLLVDPSYRDFYERRGWPAERWLELGLELDSHVMGNHPGVTFGIHLCRGNQASRWLVSGGYDWLAKRIFPKVHAERLLLEYDDERSGDFEPLREVPDDKVVVLGLVTTKTARRETVDELAARIREAARYVALDRLALSPQCGFATSVLGNALTVEDERAKLATIAETAAEVWA